VGVAAGYFSADGSPSVWGDALLAASAPLREHLWLALELYKSGCLHGDYFSNALTVKSGLPQLVGADEQVNLAIRLAALVPAPLLVAPNVDSVLLPGPAWAALLVFATLADEHRATLRTLTEASAANIVEATQASDMQELSEYVPPSSHDLALTRRISVPSRSRQAHALALSGWSWQPCSTGHLTRLGVQRMLLRNLASRLPPCSAWHVLCKMRCVSVASDCHPADGVVLTQVACALRLLHGAGLVPDEHLLEVVDSARSRTVAALPWLSAR
jgi:hypothetical protein